MPAPDSIRQLVERFEEHRESYRSGKYNETQMRREFLDSFFEALDWDVFNQQGYAEAYKDVIHEDSLEVEGATKAPDYAFRIGGTRKFFVEAKKPAVNIQYDIYPAFQLRRYAWSAKLPLSILTDFEEFAVYESRSKPDKSDSAATGRVMLLNYNEYLTKWDEIAAIFSRQAVLKGSFNQYAEGLKSRKGTTEVDDAFLEEIEHWRDLLARMIVLRNPDLHVRELNYAVQMTIDRIVFLRICEDRGIEREDQLQELLEGEGVYERLCQLFRQADSRYNSGLFHFAEEKGQSSRPDDLTLRLRVDDRVLKEIIGGLYYPSPYVFREIPADILGQVYERFLGKVIRLTSGHQAKVEEKPEVRKAGGVYYTPTYIVDYIVRNTVGKLLEGNPSPTPNPFAENPVGTPNEGHVQGGGLSPKEAAGLKILDPACGSGSFLLGAYQYLLDWHTAWYCGHEPEKWAKGKAPAIYQVSTPLALSGTLPKSASKDSGNNGTTRADLGRAGEGWRLTTAEKKRILLSNIHGVDIDSQAVEVTKLSLSLKVLEGESQESIGAQLGLFKERALPDLGRNIQCGNSLIGPDYYEGQMFPDEEERYRVNAFNWQAAFPHVFTAGGFDAVIGNPPYVRTLFLEESKEYFKKRYSTASGAYDIYVVFMERCLELACKGGLIGLITPNKYFVADYAHKLRDILLTKSRLLSITDLGKCKSVFEGALISTAITIYAKESPSNLIDLKILSDENVTQIANVPMSSIPLNQIITKDSMIRVYADADTNRILTKLYNSSDPLTSVAQVRTGVMGFDYWAMDKFIADGNSGVLIATNSYIERYSFLWGKKVRLYKREVYKPRLDPSCDIINQNTLDLFHEKKIVIRGVARRLTAMLDTEGVGILVAVHSVIGSKYSNEFLTGLLNSTLFNWIHIIQFYSARIPEGSLRYPISFLSNLPIKRMDFSDPAEKAAYDKIVSLVERMLALHKQPARTPQGQEMLRREIESTDGQIDRLLYGLYGLTEEEIKIVEGG